MKHRVVWAGLFIATVGATGHARAQAAASATGGEPLAVLGLQLSPATAADAGDVGVVSERFDVEVWPTQLHTKAVYHLHAGERGAPALAITMTPAQGAALGDVAELRVRLDGRVVTPTAAPEPRWQMPMPANAAARLEVEFRAPLYGIAALGSDAFRVRAALPLWPAAGFVGPIGRVEVWFWPKGLTRQAIAVVPGSPNTRAAPLAAQGQALLLAQDQVKAQDAADIQVELTLACRGCADPTSTPEDLGATLPAYWRLVDRVGRFAYDHHEPSINDWSHLLESLAAVPPSENAARDYAQGVLAALRARVPCEAWASVLPPGADAGAPFTLDRFGPRSPLRSGRNLVLWCEAAATRARQQRFLPMGLAGAVLMLLGLWTWRRRMAQRPQRPPAAPRS